MHINVYSNYICKEDANPNSKPISTHRRVKNQKKNTQDCWLFFVVFANSLILISNAFAWITYSFMDASEKMVKVTVGGSVDHGLPIRLVMTFLLPTCTLAGIYVNKCFHDASFTSNWHQSFHILWLFNMIGCMRSVMGGSNFHIAVAVSLLLVPYIFIHPNLFIPQIHLVFLSVCQISWSFVILSFNYGVFQYDDRNVKHTWLHMTGVNTEYGIGTAVLLVLILSLFYFFVGVWLQRTFITLSIRSVIIVIFSIFISGMVVCFFPMSLLLPVSANATSLFIIFRIIQFGCILATNTCILSISTENNLRHFSKSCIVVVIGLILHSFVHEAGDITLLLRCVLVNVFIIVLDPILSFLVNLK